MEGNLMILRTKGLHRYQELRSEAITVVSDRFYFDAANQSIYEKFGAHGMEACREDIGFHLEFLRPVLEFGVLQPMIDYLVWLAEVFSARSIPVQLLTQSLEWMAAFFAWRMDRADGVVVSDALKAALTGYLKALETPAARSPPIVPWPEQRAFVAALLAGRRIEALTVASSCLDEGRNLVDLEQNLIAPSLCQIGEDWQSNRATVAQEHIATAIAQSVMTMGLLRLPRPADNGRSVLLACVEGNHHAVGLNMVYDAFLLDGWEAQYLGANMPTLPLVNQVIERKPDLVGLSVSFAHQLRVVKNIVARLNERLGDARPAVIVGGLAINRYPQLAVAVGADAHAANAAAAVAYGYQSTGS